MLGFYFVLVVILLVAVVVIGSLTLADFGSINPYVEKEWTKFSYEDREWILLKFNCCGYDEPDNSTLCEEAKKQDPKILGCRQKLTEWVLEHLTIVLYVSLPIALLFIAGLSLTCFLLCTIPHRKEERKQLLSHTDHSKQPRGYH
eukprot:TRINITY_DN1080_c0_g1_i3.p1 TRINITY_DN1080_c0_g1~~TRINITY_DN1080_c0_g1_i3.p1  ORF type:complete len:145 (-),score=13.01 TRINITY_DN1080_c0_g1_i3:75-509(-)